MDEDDTGLYLLHKNFLMAELMRPRGKQFDIKKNFKNSKSRCMVLHKELILNPRKINVFKKLTLKLKEQKLKKRVPKPVKVFLRKTEV